MTTVSERLIFLMENMDMKQTELAERIGISKQSLYKYLHCKCEPRAEIIARMAKVLHTSADYIVGLTNDSAPRVTDESHEKSMQLESDVICKFRRLSREDRIRIEERIDLLLEIQENV